ncbi:MAG: hypothetical protein K0Q74_79 [Gammaproteobacteria bacterium]|nr:hypothetical protein [Gammaproteobacteria bacterium]
MSLDLIIRLDTLRSPLSGIGYYTFHLLRELLIHPDINDIIGISSTCTRNKQALHQLIQQYETSHLSDTTHINASRYIQNIPGAYILLKKLIDLKEQKAMIPYRQWLYHEPSFLSLQHQGPSIVTVHDLSHLRHPETHPQHRVKLLNKKLPDTLNRANHIITDSAFTRDELLDTHLVEDAARVSVVHLGVDPLFYPRPLEAIAPCLSELGLTPQTYVLAIGTIEPRKNLPRLLRAYERLPDHLKRSFSLVLVGARGWHDKQLLTDIKTLIPPGKVICTGYLPREKLAAVLAGAAVFAFPSLYEGFGLPVLEAFASGVPVLTSNNSALKEIAQDCALLTNPLDIDDISDKLARLLGDTGKTDTLKQRGIQQAQKFSWRRCADLTVQAYQKAFFS